jgi:hypothetical protein
MRSAFVISSPTGNVGTGKCYQTLTWRTLNSKLNFIHEAEFMQQMRWGAAVALSGRAGEDEEEESDLALLARFYQLRQRG